MTFPMNMTLKIFKFLSKKSPTFVTGINRKPSNEKLINNNKTTSQYLYYLFNCSINNTLVHTVPTTRAIKIFSTAFFKEKDEDSHN